MRDGWHDTFGLFGYVPWSFGSSVQSRMARVAGRQENKAVASRNAEPRRPPAGIRQDARSYGGGHARLGLRMSHLKQRCAQAGIRTDKTIAALYYFRILSMMVLILSGFLLIYAALYHEDILESTAYCAVSAGILLVCPDLYIRFRSRRRSRSLQQSLPDAIDLLVVCAESGLGLDASLRKVATEMVSVDPEFAYEIDRAVVELTFLPDRSDALRNLADRVGLPDVSSVMQTLIQTERYGTPLAQALRAASQDIKESNLMMVEQKAARLPALMTIPLALFILPPLFIVLVGPAVLNVLDKMIK